MSDFEKDKKEFLEKNLRAIRAPGSTKPSEFWTGFIFGASTAWVIAAFFMIRFLIGSAS